MFRKKNVQSALPPEWMIVGLGNPGPAYRGTRHNVGFDAVEFMAKENGIRLSQHRFQAEFGVGRMGVHEVVLIKPLTFMNLSGQAVGALSRHFALKADRLIVIADDLDLPVGALRIRPKGSAGGHNGHKSIIQSFGTDQYIRIKIGVGKVDKSDTVDHVLGKFHPDERSEVHEVIDAISKAIPAIMQDGVESAMTRFNRTG